MRISRHQRERERERERESTESLRHHSAESKMNWKNFRIQLKFSSSNPDCSFTQSDKNSLLSHCGPIYVTSVIISAFIFHVPIVLTDRRSLKLENENDDTKILPYIWDEGP